VERGDDREDQAEIRGRMGVTMCMIMCVLVRMVMRVIVFGVMVCGHATHIAEAAGVTLSPCIRSVGKGGAANSASSPPSRRPAGTTAGEAFAGTTEGETLRGRARPSVRL